MFNERLALLQPEQERIQRYLGTACRTTQAKQQSSGTSSDTWICRKARLSPSTGPRAPGYNSALSADLKILQLIEKEILLPMQVNRTTVGARAGCCCRKVKSPLLYIKLGHLLSFTLNSSSAQIQSKASSKHNKGFVVLLKTQQTPLKMSLLYRNAGLVKMTNLVEQWHECILIKKS